jgi:phosphomannomutase
LRAVDPEGKLNAIWLLEEPDGNFPWHAADPTKPVNLRHLQGAVLATGADCGIAFDADGDRLYLIDEQARPIGCDLTTALFATELLSQPGNRGKNVMYDLRGSLVVKEAIEAAGGVPEMCRVGHSHVKTAMRGHRQGIVLDPTQKGEVIFAGEISGHFFFRDCFIIDTSERAFLLALQLLTHHPQPLSRQVAPLRKYYQSGEINYRLPTEEKKRQVLENIERHFQKYSQFKLDGLSVKSDHWYFNVRFSNTEPVVRLAVESFVSAADQEQLLAEVEAMILSLGGVRLAR